MQVLNCPFGDFILHRYPPKQDDTLRAWDAADEYILQYLQENELIKPSIHVFIANDSFGGLGVALADVNPTSLSDSYLAHQATQHNLLTNQIADSQVTLLTSLQLPNKGIDVLLLKIPKSLAMLEDQLHRLRPFLNQNSIIVAAAMAKHIHTSTLKLFESIIGPTTTSLAKKKARLVFCQLDEQLQVKANPYPKSYHAEKPPITLINHANVFAQQGLDIGSRFLMEHMPSSPDVKTILDLGCGNGVLGITAAFHNPQAKLIFTDESFMAVASAQTNFTNALPGRDGEFICTDCLESIEDNSIDLILNNPPFHQQHTVGDHIAWQMFLQSKSRLKPRGELWVIGNRHLGYHIKLKRLFGNCTTVASNSKFVILKSIKHHSSR